MIYNPTAEEHKKYSEMARANGHKRYAIDDSGKIYSYLSMPFKDEDGWMPKSPFCYIFSVDVEKFDYIENWRDLCFEVQSEGVDEFVGNLSIICEQCNEKLLFENFNKQDCYTVKLPKHECKPKEELPVNEDCLFQPVLYQNSSDVILNAFHRQDKKAFVFGRVGHVALWVDLNTLKRIPGFNYKKPEWLE